MLLVEAPGCDYNLRLVESGPVVLVLDFDPGQSAARITEAVEGDAALREAFTELKAGLNPDRLLVHDGRVTYTFPEAWWEKAPAPEKLVALVRAFVAAVTAHTPPWDELCRTCFARAGRLTYAHHQAARLCDECRQAADREGARLAQLDQEESADAGGGAGVGFMLAMLTQFEAMQAVSTGFEQRFLRSPGRGWNEVLGWVALGQAALAAGVVFLALVLGAGLGLLVGLFVLGRGAAIYVVFKLLPVLLAKGWKLLVVLGLALGGCWRSLWSWLRRPEPHGMPGVQLDRDRAPQFFRWLDELAERVGVQPVDLVAVHHELNASAAEVKLPGRGYQRLLTVGIPLLEVLGEEEFASVMCHELAHLHHEDTKSLWIYRTTQAWLNVAGRTEEDQERGFGSFAAFAYWYAPRFLARAHVIQRAGEREADRRSRELTSAEHLAGGLVKAAVAGRLYDEQLETWFKDSRDAEGWLEAVLRAVEAVPDERVQEVYRQCLEEEANWMSSHPALKERLELLDVPLPDRLELDLRPERPATSLFDDYPELRREALARPTERLNIALTQLHRQRAGYRRKLEMVREQAAAPEISRWQAGTLLVALNREEEALEEFRALLESSRAEEARVEVCGLLRELGRFEEALHTRLESFDLEESESVPALLLVFELAGEAQDEEARERARKRLLAIAESCGEASPWWQSMVLSPSDG